MKLRGLRPHHNTCWLERKPHLPPGHVQRSAAGVSNGKEAAHECDARHEVSPHVPSVARQAVGAIPNRVRNAQVK